MILFFLIMPILAIMPLSFSSGNFLTYPLPGLSLHWYQEIITSDKWLPSLRNSLIIGVSSTILATILGTVASLGLSRAHFPHETRRDGYSVIADDCSHDHHGRGSLFLFCPSWTDQQLSRSDSSSYGTGRSFCRGIGIGDYGAVRHHYVSCRCQPGSLAPIVILPGHITADRARGSIGALFAFATSFDEVVVVLMIAGPDQRTLPREMFSGIRESINPTITAVATVLILISVLLLICLEALRRRSERMAG